MQIAIFDFDFQEGIARYPNPFLAKFSSYHKQLGDTVAFETPDIHLENYDIVYAGSLLEASSKVPLRLLFAANVKLIGDVFKHMDNYQPFPEVVAQVRPDYLLYDFPYKNDFTEASFAQFSNYNRLIKTQNWKKDKYLKPFVIVMDQNMWNFPREEIIKILKALEGVRNVYFLYPVRFSALFDVEVRQAFLDLTASPGREIEFVDFTNNYQEIIEVLASMKYLRKPHFNKPTLGIAPQNHLDRNNRMLSLLRAIVIKTECNKKGIIIKLTSVPNIIDESFFSLLSNWSSTPRSLLSYVTRHSKQHPVEAILNKAYWTKDITDFIKLMLEYPNLLDYIGIGWNGAKTDLSGLTLEALQELKNDLPIL